MKSLSDFRTETIGDCTLILGDCREILPLLPKVDAVVTDPPYGIGFRYATHIDDAEHYPEFLWPRIEAAEERVCDGGPVFVWQAQAWIPRFHELFPRQWRLFIAAKNFVQMRPTVMQHAYEPIVVWWKDGPKQEWGKDFDLVKRDWFVADSARQVLRVGALERQHPCPRQLDACEYIVAIWCKPKGFVLDPFMGSGTTGVACVKLGRKFIGIEIDESYFSIACRRIEDAYKQPDLFVEQVRAPKAEQLQLLGAAE